MLENVSDTVRRGIYPDDDGENNLCVCDVAEFNPAQQYVK